MRAALAGIPIVNPEWIGHCSDSKKIVPPTKTMFIRTLPSKTDALVGGKVLTNGVALQAARLQQQKVGDIPKDDSTLPLRGVHVQLCSAFKAPKKSDVQLLLRESGASILSSASATSKLLKSASFLNNEHKVVLLFDDASTNMTAAQAKELKSLMVANPGRITIANPHWLFDSVSCGQPAPSNLYEPKSHRGRDLWVLSCTNDK